jgi:hypothetical protein
VSGGVNFCAARTPQIWTALFHVVPMLERSDFAGMREMLTRNAQSIYDWLTAVRCAGAAGRPPPRDAGSDMCMTCVRACVCARCIR